jgi:hydroxyacylglutathione hydrolase
MYKVENIPCLKDNYAWALRPIDRASSSQCIIIDPGEARAVQSYLDQHHLTLEAILITHNHYDHTGGVSELVSTTPCPVYGPQGTPVVSSQVSEGDTLLLGNNSLSFTIWETPGHCPEHISYVGEGIVFCGDTLFSCGCGRILGSTPQKLYESLKRLATLPDDTLVYCGHEYTKANSTFAAKLLPGDESISEFKRAVEALKVTLPSTIAVEKRVNPFLRVGEEEVQRRVLELSGEEGLRTEAEYFRVIRSLKDGGL